MVAPASESYTKLKNGLDNVITQLSQHPQLPGPGARKNKVQFLLEFVSTTRAQLLQLSPTAPEKDAEAWFDVTGRATFAEVLINSTDGKLSMLCGERPGEEIDLGDKVRESSKTLEW